MNKYCSVKAESKPSLKNEIINLIHYIRTVPQHKFDAADIADMIIRRYFRSLDGDLK